MYITHKLSSYVILYFEISKEKGKVCLFNQYKSMLTSDIFVNAIKLDLSTINLYKFHNFVIGNF